MRCLLLVTTILLVLIQGTWLVNATSFTQTIQQCKNQTKANEDEVNNVLMHQVPQTNNENCMLACLQKKIQFMGSDNKMNLEKILKSIDHIKNFNMGRYEKMKKIYEDCSAAETAESDECIAAYNFAQCVYPKQMRIQGPLNINNYRMSVSECSNKTGVSDDERKSVLHHEIPSTKNAQCLLACMLKKAEILATDNKINMEKVHEPLQNMKKYNNDMYNKTIKIFEECKAKEITEIDECLAAKRFAECVYPKERLNRLGQKMRTNIAVCGNSTKASELEIDTVASHNVPKTNNEKCLFACLQKRMGVMKTDNTMDIDQMKSNFKHMKERQPEFYNQIEKVLDECKAKETKEADECVAAGKFAECVYPKEKGIRDTLLHQHQYPHH